MKEKNKTKNHNIFHNQSSFDYFNIFIKFKAKFSCVFISCNYIFFTRHRSEKCKLHFSRCILYIETSEVLVEFQTAA